MVGALISGDYMSKRKYMERVECCLLDILFDTFRSVCWGFGRYIDRKSKKSTVLI